MGFSTLSIFCHPLPVFYLLCLVLGFVYLFYLEKQILFICGDDFLSRFSIFYNIILHEIFILLYLLIFIQFNTLFYFH